MVEQGTHNPLVGGSNPSGPTNILSSLALSGLFFVLGNTLGFEPMRWKRVKKTALWAVFSVSGEAL